MLLLTVLASFGMFAVILLIGIAIGYSLGYKNDRTLKQQITKLKGTIKQQNKSAQLRELTTSELKQRDDWDFRSKMAELMNQPVTTPDVERSDDLHDMSHMF